MQEEYRPGFGNGKNESSESAEQMSGSMQPENGNVTQPYQESQPNPPQWPNDQNMHADTNFASSQPPFASNRPEGQWNYCDYGPIGTEEPKSANDHKKEKKPGAGLRVFAIVMSVLFVLSAGGFAAVLLGGQFKQTVSTESSEVSGPLFQTESTPDGTADDEIIEGEPLTNSQIYRKVEPAVVGIVGYTRSVTGTQPMSQGSGVVFREDGYIVTNNHVVTNEETGAVYDKIEVILSSGDSYIATFVGGDRQSDLAVLKVDATGMHAAVFGDSDKLEVGDEAIVIGNPSGLALAGSFTHGYISALNRTVYVSTIGSNVNFIQTDAAINSGNSGGALLNMQGELIGINEAKSSNTSSGASVDNIGFAIPIDKAQSSLQEMMNLETREKVDADQASYLGIQGSDVSAEVSELYGVPSGVVVVDVVEDGPAAEAGMQKGDVITELDGRSIGNMEQLQDVLQYYASGETVKVTVQRSQGGSYQEQEISVTLGSAQDAEK